MSAAIAEPAPTAGVRVVLDVAVGRTRVTELQDDLKARAEMGKAKYGTYLRTFNGRDALTDAYQEALDLVMYLVQVNLETGNQHAMLELDALALAERLSQVVTR